MAKKKNNDPVVVKVKEMESFRELVKRLEKTMKNKFGLAVSFHGCGRFETKDDTIMFASDASVPGLLNPKYVVQIDDNGDIADVRIFLTFGNDTHYHCSYGYSDGGLSTNSNRIYILMYHERTMKGITMGRMYNAVS